MNKNIFKYHDGTAERHGDPHRIDRLLTAHLGGDRKAAIQRTQSPALEIALPAMEKLLDAIAAAFEMPRLSQESGQGATEDQLLDVLDAFIDWKAEKKKSTVSLLTSPASTDLLASSTLPSPSTSPALQPTKSSSDCGCS